MTFGPADGDSLIGRVLDSKYRIDRLLGRGGFGSVYLATHLMLDHPCAIKVLHRSVLADSMAVARFQQEARATVRIRHPNAISVMDFGITPDSVVYFVMEYFPGASLREVLRQTGPMPLWRAAYVLDCVAGALASAHAQGILHRDVKPDNIMIARRQDGGDEVKVVDFGIAKLLDAPGGAQPLTLAGTILGTPYYLSPEQVNGHPLDPRSDIYALGVVTYEMLTGAVPFNAPTPIAVALKHLSEAPPALNGRVPGLTQHVERTLLRALAKRPEDRYPSTIAFANEFSAAVRASTTGPRDVPSAPLPVTSHIQHPDTPQPRGYSTGSASHGTPTMMEQQPTPHTPLPPAQPTTAIPWQQDLTVPLSVANTPPPSVPPRSAPPPVAPPVTTGQPPRAQGPLHHLDQQPARVPTPVPTPVPPPAPPTPARTGMTPTAMIAIGVSVLALLAAGGLAAAVYWTQSRASAPEQPEASAPSTPTPVATVPLLDVSVAVVAEDGKKSQVDQLDRPVPLPRGDSFVQFSVGARTAGYVYIVDALGDELQTQLTAQPDPKGDVKSNEVKPGTSLVFPGATQAIRIQKPMKFTIVFSPTKIESPALLSGPSKRILDAKETEDWKRFVASAHRADGSVDRSRKALTIAGPDPKTSTKPAVYDISFDVK
jgi:serine/threonine protein kinase